ncbi:D-alanyl-D-alanine carboxypeptidase family protein [Nitratireductor indicus]|uniref:Peptidase S11, D-alanyl-D-alanine carboxypeptidase 1 n=1 Tax=Nitratireductor indicus C115 TaxID=1231190 RepID=K2P3N1_9HYPH|nr:D-alanyl-D-alanine carboxypeptidase family protein [Nitratireductor indicus]EKF41996.1 peptidase S11, D-alanyl-D-alanine carboxypeptidase 1 [Nitratireductor indicus C115]SFQ47287.1 D-alanyl-D-alanine carboxypeptidase [Nitratireductor indicus]
MSSMKCSAAFLAVLFLGLVTAILPAKAGASIVIDVGSGKVLSHENAFQRWYPASLTKLMTAYVAFRTVKAGEMRFDSPVRISANAAKEPPSKMGYPVGSVLTLDNALKIIMVKSANDIATSIGESIAGSERAFAARMNQTARQIGMTGSHFVNAHGLYSTEQYTTAHDLAVLVRAIRTEFPEHAHYFSLEAIQAGDKIMPNYNWLIGRFQGADGMKTGYICSSGFNLASTATRNGRTLAAIVLGAPSQVKRGEKAAELLTQGFKAPGFGAPTLASLTPYGQNRNVAIDLRPQICSKEAVAERVEERDDEGRLMVNSPYIRPMDHDPRPVLITLGGATGPESKAPRFANVPIPTPRPDYNPGGAAMITGQGG